METLLFVERLSGNPVFELVEWKPCCFVERLEWSGRSPPPLAGLAADKKFGKEVHGIN